MNLYFPGTLELSTPSGRSLVVRIDTAYPVGEEITLELSLDEPESFELALRIPGWCAAPEAQINGETVTPSPGWLRLERHWEDKDKVCLRFPVPVDAVGSWQLGPGSGELPPHLALVRGPVVLAASEEFPGCDLSKPVEFARTADGAIRALPLSEVPFEAQQAFKVALQNGWMEFTDYASAGKGYDKRIAIWVRVRQ